ncbi:Hint domain-containing protein [Falsigemmobacter intermedius]|nr:Hint domain-containing protein [Falsigemmobacter intermedius]
MPPPLAWLRAEQAGGVLHAVGGLRLTSDGSTPVDPFLLNTDNTGVVCFAAGTRIRTLRGPVAVEALRIGDLLATRDAGWQPLRWVSSQEVSKRALDDQPQFNPVRIPAGAFGGGCPRAIFTSPASIVCCSALRKGLNMSYPPKTSADVPVFPRPDQTAHSAISTCSLTAIT